MSADFSECGNYRYRLDRKLDFNGSKTYAFLGINPSTAGKDDNDPSLARMLIHARNNGANHCIVGTVFSWISSDVSELARINDPLGLERDKYLHGIIKDADVLVVCWGNKSKVPMSLRHHFDIVLSTLVKSGKPLMCLAKNKSGDPKHPLYASTSSPLIQFLS